MIYFITGAIDSGKSTKLLSIYKALQKGDGFYNVRRYKQRKTIGQDIVHLSTAKSIPFSRIDGFIPKDWDESEHFMNYSFSKQGLDFTKDIVNQIITKKIKVAYIDELGSLELQKQGLYEYFKILVLQDIDIYAVCRTSCLKPVIDLFDILDYKIYFQTNDNSHTYT